MSEQLDCNGLKCPQPVLKLANLSPEDLYVLLTKVRHVHALGDPEAYLLPDEGIKAFMEHCHRRVGEAYFRTPRSTITAFVNLLAVIEQNPKVTLEELLPGVTVEREVPPEAGEGPAGDEEGDGAKDGDDLTTFRL